VSKTSTLMIQTPLRQRIVPKQSWMSLHIATMAQTISFTFQLAIRLLTDTDRVLQLNLGLPVERVSMTSIVGIPRKGESKSSHALLNPLGGLVVSSLTSWIRLVSVLLFLVRMAHPSLATSKGSGSQTFLLSLTNVSPGALSRRPMARKEGAPRWRGCCAPLILWSSRISPFCVSHCPMFHPLTTAAPWHLRFLCLLCLRLGAPCLVLLLFPCSQLPPFLWASLLPRLSFHLTRRLLHTLLTRMPLSPRALSARMSVRFHVLGRPHHLPFWHFPPSSPVRPALKTPFSIHSTLLLTFIPLPLLFRRFHTVALQCRSATHLVHHHQCLPPPMAIGALRLPLLTHSVQTAFDAEINAAAAISNSNSHLSAFVPVPHIALTHCLPTPLQLF